MRDRLIRDLRRGDAVEVLRGGTRARVLHIGGPPPGEPEDALEVHIEFLDGRRKGERDSVVLRPLQRVRLTHAN